MARKGNPFEDLPSNATVHMQLQVPWVDAAWLPGIIGRSADWVDDNILYPCNPKTKAPLIDPQTGEIVLGPPVAQLGYQKIILWEDLLAWIRKRANPLTRSTWKNLLTKGSSSDHEEEKSG